MKHYPLLTALIMALAYLAFGAGCCWEEPVEVGAESAAILATTSTGDPEPPQLPPPPEVMVVECDSFIDGHYWAELEYPGYTWEQLSALRAVAHYAGSYYPTVGYEQEQRLARLQDGKVIVSCDGAVDHITFMWPD